MKKIKTEDIVFQVVTKVSDNNHYDEMGYRKTDNSVGSSGEYVYIDTKIDNINKENFVQVRQIIAKVGEILIVEKEYGRELQGYFGGRNLDKWEVEYRTFKDLVKAINFSRKITKDL